MPVMDDVINQRFLRRAGLLAACAAFALVSCSAAAVTFPLSWRWANPMPHGANVIDIARRDSLWIQVAERGQVFTSEDLITWTPRVSHTTRDLRGVTFLGEDIVIAGESGTIVTGPSADTLSFIDLGTADWLESVTASPTLAVAVGDNGAIYTSSDGREWGRQTTSFGNWLRSVTYGTPNGAGIFVAVGEAGFIATSLDGIAWQARNSSVIENLNRVTWSNGEFWAVGDGGIVLLSTSGTEWGRIQTGAISELNAFVGLNSIRAVAGNGEVRARLGRSTWNDEMRETNPLPPPNWTYLSATVDGNRVLLCGRTGMIVEGRLSLNSTMLWAPLFDSARSWLWDVKRFPSVFVAVGDRATILSSVSGLSWQPELPPDSATNSILLGVGGRTNLAVAVGSSGTIITSLDLKRDVVTTNASGGLVTNQVSTLGIFWEGVQPRPTTNDLQGIGVALDRFIATGAFGTILTSSDARIWTRQNSPTSAFLSSVEGFPGGAVIVGDEGTILTSSDGSNWTLRPTGLSHWIYRVRYLNGRLLAVGQNGLLLTSTDGISWEPRNTGTSLWLNDVQWIQDTYFIVGAEGTVLSSSDTLTWTSRGTITGKSLFAAAANNGQLVTVGLEGVILRSQVGPITSPVNFVRFPRQPNEKLFVLTGPAGQKFTLDRSINLQSWIPGPLLQIENSGTLSHVDGSSNSTTRQFFRTTLKE